MKEYYAKAIDTERYALGESPFYDPRFNRYSWVDIINNRIITMRAGQKHSFTFNEPIGAAIPLSESDGFLLAAKNGLYLLNSKDEIRLFLDLTKEFKPYLRSNDAKADSKGRIWFGSSVGEGEYEPEGNLYCFDNGKLKYMQKNTEISNGMAWSKDNQTFYFSDSPKKAIFRYRYDSETNEISDREILFKTENGIPDGMCIDADDNLYVAIWGGHRIEKRDGKTGELLALIHVDATNVTSCCFGPDLNTLFITTSGNDLKGEYDGCLFECRIEGNGIIANYFKF